MTVTTTRPAPPETILPDLAASGLHRDSLLDAVNYVRASIPARPPIQVLLGVLLEGTPQGLRLSGFDYDTARTDTIPGVAAGRALVPAAVLADVLKVLDKGAEVRLTVTGTDLTVSCNDDTFTLPTFELADYPERWDSSGLTTVATVTGGLLREVASSVLPAAGRDDSLPVLNAVRVETGPDGLTFAATDRYRLNVLTVDMPVVQGEPLLVPHAVFADLAKQTGKTEQVTITAGVAVEGLVAVAFGSRTLTARLLDGTFPSYRALLPSPDAPADLIVLPAKTTVAAIKKAAVATVRNEPVLLRDNPRDGTVAIGAGRDDSSVKAHCPVKDASSTRPAPEGPREVGLNPRYLLDALAAVGTDLVTARVPGGHKPLLFTSPERPGFLSLLMPVRLGDS